MGDFTSRCAVSGLPLWGRPVVMVGLSVAFNKQYREGAVTTFDLFHIASLPIYGRYNDYGFIDHIENVSAEKATLEAWSLPDSTLQNLFFRDEETNHAPIRKWNGKQFENGTCLIDRNVWNWLLSNSPSSYSNLLASFDECWPKHLEEMKKTSKDTGWPLDQCIDLRGRQFNVQGHTEYNEFMYCVDSIGVFAGPMRALARKALIEGSREIINDLMSLYCVSMTLRDIDKFWQPSSTAGDQYGDVTKLKLNFAKFHYDNMKAMRKEQLRKDLVD